MKLIFVGPPGAGKGTQAVGVAKEYSIPHISTGDMLRAELKAKSELGREAQAYIDRGELVPDGVIINMVKNRINEDDCKNGYLLDGFPRTIAQAEELLGFAKINRVINLEVPVETLVRRISARYLCKDCGAAYNLPSPDQEKLCTACGAKLYQREDDKAETVKKRLAVYQAQTAPLIEYFSNKGLLSTVNGDRSVEIVHQDIILAVNGNNE